MKKNTKFLVSIVVLLALTLAACGGAASDGGEAGGISGEPEFMELIVDAILTRDYFIVQAFVLISATAFVLINLLVDLSYVVIDPRIRVR